MSVQIGDNNKIHNSIVAEKIEAIDTIVKRKSFFERHPVLCGFLISFAAGLVLLLSFWQRIICFLEGLF